MAIRTKDKAMMDDAEEFLKLFADEYTDHVSGVAAATLNTRKNHLLEFPDEEDFSRLKAFQLERQTALQAQLSSDAAVDPSVWRELAEVVLSRVIVFNGRRGNEAALLRVDTYRQRGNDHVQPMLQESMDDVEKALLERLAHFFAIDIY
jgi:hypothetical protein